MSSGACCDAAEGYEVKGVSEALRGGRRGRARTAEGAHPDLRRLDCHGARAHTKQAGECPQDYTVHRRRATAPPARRAGQEGGAAMGGPREPRPRTPLLTRSRAGNAASRPRGSTHTFFWLS